MRKRLPKILVTGGAGFIGSACLRQLVEGGACPAVVDCLTYAGDLKRLQSCAGKFKFYRASICNQQQIEAIFAKEKPALVLHFAAESHVDRSIKDAAPFIETNIKGTQVLLDACRKFKIKKFVFISTDEVYGEIARGKFSETSPLRPNSPYAASKAAGDLLVQSYVRTYNFPALIIRPSNNYGPWQYPEKLIPLAILRILSGEKVPVYGRGENVREWLYVDDCASGILKIAWNGRPGQIYNLGGACESKNLNTVKLLLDILGANPGNFRFVKDRPGHDFRYCLNSARAKHEIGWEPKIKLKEGLSRTVDWALKNRGWLESKLKDINKLYGHG